VLPAQAELFQDAVDDDDAADAPLNDDDKEEEPLDAAAAAMSAAMEAEAELEAEAEATAAAGKASRGQKGSLMARTLARQQAYQVKLVEQAGSTGARAAVYDLDDGQLGSALALYERFDRDADGSLDCFEFCELMECAARHNGVRFAHRTLRLFFDDEASTDSSFFQPALSRCSCLPCGHLSNASAHPPSHLGRPPAGLSNTLDVGKSSTTLPFVCCHATCSRPRLHRLTSRAPARSTSTRC